MTKPWTEALQPSEVVFMNDIIAQVPEAMGARSAFITCLQNLADHSESKPKFRYVITQDGDVVGTNDLTTARDAAADETWYVIDTVANKWFTSPDEDGDSDILEAS